MEAADKVMTFVPRRRFAVLINRWDNPKEFDGGYTHLEYKARGNRHVFELEYALRRGKLDLTQEIAHDLSKMGFEEEAKRAAEIDSRARELKIRYGQESFDIIADRFPGGAARAATMLACAAHVFITGRIEDPAPAIHYDELRKVFPDSADLRGEVFDTLSLYRSLADKDSLTLLFIESHGEPGGVAEFKYAELLDRLDPIEGEKAIINLSCFSGSLVDEVRQRAAARHYAVIASTEATREGSNWNDDTIVDDLTALISRARPLSEYDPGPYHDSIHTQLPTVHLPFDVVL